MACGALTGLSPLSGCVLLVALVPPFLLGIVVLVFFIIIIKSNLLEINLDVSLSESVLSFHLIGPEGGTQAVRVGGGGGE